MINISNFRVEQVTSDEDMQTIITGKSIFSFVNTVFVAARKHNMKRKNWFYETSIKILRA
jgi:plasmid replication initiation protein